MIRSLLLPALIIAAVATGCRGAGTSGLDVSETTFRASPVVIEAFRVGDLDLIRGLPRVVAGAADVTTGRRGGGPSSYAGFDDDPLDINITWVELLTDRAYSASLSLDRSDLPRSPTGAASLVVVLGPNGLLVVADDTAGPDARRDVVVLCAMRSPADDIAWRRRDPLSLPGLTEALAETYPPVAVGTRCPDPGQ